MIFPHFAQMASSCSPVLGDAAAEAFRGVALQNLWSSLSKEDETVLTFQVEEDFGVIISKLLLFYRESDVSDVSE